MLPLVPITIRNFPEILEGQFPPGATIPWVLVAAFYFSFALWVGLRWRKFRQESRMIEAYLLQIGGRGVAVGRTRSRFGGVAGSERGPESTWVVVPVGGFQVLLVDVVLAYQEVHIQPLPSPILSIKLSPSSFSKGAPPALEVLFADQVSSHIEIEGPYGSLFRPSVRAVEDALSHVAIMSED